MVVEKAIIKNKKTGREAVVCRTGRETELGRPRWACIQYVNKKTCEASGMYFWVALDKWDVVRTEKVNEFTKLG